MIYQKSLFKTRQQIALELGVSYSTLRRRIKESKIFIKGNLIPPEKTEEIKSLFGVSGNLRNAHEEIIPLWKKQS